MVKANELRIDNFITDIYDELICIEAIGKDAEGFKGHYIKAKGRAALIEESQEESFLFGIPLTDEWLVKLGFKDFQSGYSVTFDNRQAFCWFNNDLYFDFDDQTAVRMTFGNIKYVHQLQNVYHALTGQELTIQQPEKV